MNLNLVYLILLFLVVGFFYSRYENKRVREQEGDYRDAIQNYLLDDVALMKSKKPILWLHVPYEYNSRHWLSFGSRSSFELNQPYLHLTVRTIIAKCDKSFTICIIDDKSFDKLIPGWSINMSFTSSPISEKVRQLACMKLLHRYGGMFCPISFVCFKDLMGMYEKGTSNNKMFVCENIDKNVTSQSYDFYPDLNFCGAPRENSTVASLIEFMQRTISKDFTQASIFLGEFNRWLKKKSTEGQVNIINGMDVGVKGANNKPIRIEDLMSNNYLDLYPQAYGIWIPANEILNRRQFEWFSRLSEKQVLHTDTIIGNYILVNMPPSKSGNLLEPISNKTVEQEFVSFWKVPSGAPVWGLKPYGLGDNIPKIKYPGLL